MMSCRILAQQLEAKLRTLKHLKGDRAPKDRSFNHCDRGQISFTFLYMHKSKICICDILFYRYHKEQTSYMK